MSAFVHSVHAHNRNTFTRMHIETGKRYRHYKGGEYEVVALARLESDPQVECVVYRALYESPDYGSGAVWIRPRESFEEVIVHDGVPTPRFCAV